MVKPEIAGAVHVETHAWNPAFYKRSNVCLGRIWFLFDSVRADSAQQSGDLAGDN